MDKLQMGAPIEKTVIREALIEDIKYVVSLSKKESFSLGFIPKMAYESAITGIKTGKRWSPVCNDKLFICSCNDDLVGFCLASFGRKNSIYKTGKIAQICLQEDARKLERGKLLLNAVIEWGKKINTLAFNAGCADDLESNFFWRAMGWEKIGMRFGIGHKNTWVQTSKRKINIYNYDPYSLVFDSIINKK
jgi:GNAT superfamily N-acetyltransferase